MQKKIITACLAVVALAAFALPATASATNDPLLTHPTGVAATVGSPIRAHLVGTESILWDTNKERKELVCSTATMTGKLTKNGGGTVEGEIFSAKFGGTGSTNPAEPEEPECTGAFAPASVTASVSEAAPWCVRSTPLMVTDEFQVGSGKCGAAGGKVTFSLVTTGLGTCKYISTGVIKGTYTTHPEDAIFHVKATKPSGVGNGFTREEGSFLCPSSGQLEMSFTLETDGPGPTEPVWIS